jgi:signal transduction histidine kinase
VEVREPSGKAAHVAEERSEATAQPPRSNGGRAPRPRTIGSGLSSPERLRQELAQAQKMDAIGHLVAGVAHDVSNPLAAIAAFSQLLRTDPRLPDDLRREAQLLVEEVDRTRRVVQNFLDFARRRPPERHPTDLRLLVDSVLDLQAFTIGSRGIEVEVEIEPDVPPVPVDRSQMQQVLLNLTMNAIQALAATGRHGRMRIHASLTRRGVERVVALAVSDDGPGIPDEMLDRAFAPFFSTRPDGDGSGLGLPVSVDIVAAHGGRLRHERSATGRGATFVVELPLAEAVAGADVAAVAVQEPAAIAATDARPATRPARILVVDDEPSIRRFVFQALQHAGFEPVLATSGPDAIDLVRNAPVDAILCDHRMSQMSGLDVYDALVAIRPELTDRFVFMSGDILDQGLREFAESHHAALLAKPFDLASVGRTVRDVLARSGARGGARGAASR